MVQLVDSKRTKTYADFIDFIIGNLIVFHDNVRKDVRVPILVVIESQNSWNSDLIEDNVVQRRDKERVAALQNLHFIKDPSKRDTDTDVIATRVLTL